MFQVLTHRHTGEASWASSWALPHGMKKVQREGMGGGKMDLDLQLMCYV